jgi:hypothetical protein
MDAIELMQDIDSNRDLGYKKEKAQLAVLK